MLCFFSRIYFLIDNLEKLFSSPLLTWFDQYGRKDLPWQSPKDPYRIWVSEIMLQQTQVQTVIPYFNRFIDVFPTIEHLAQAEEDTVLSLWSGLGYYSRARNLHKTAQLVCKQYSGVMPEKIEQLIELPGIGPSTAAAILSQAYNLPTAILDGNVKRVLTRFFRVEGWPEQASIKKSLWKHANDCMPKQRCADYTQAIMDLGAICCTLKNPQCHACPVQLNCQAKKYQEQTLYPTKKPPKKLPIQYQQFLILRTNQQLIYLEKRPPVGLWGGLWCLPSITQERCPLNYIKEQYQVDSKETKLLTSLTHRFSHFQLEIDAIIIEIKQLKQNSSENQGKWFSYEKLSEVGLAKPTTLILKKLFLEKS